MRKRRQFKAGRCYHLVSRVAHRAFFFDHEQSKLVKSFWLGLAEDAWNEDLIQYGHGKRTDKI